MKYIFFDIECANCFNGKGKICSFGFVVTDEKFNVIKKKDIVINPHAIFHLSGHKNQAPIVLAYDEEEFFRAPSFPRFYEYIKNLLTDDDAIIFGYSVMSDAGFLKSECERYNKKVFDYNFIDVQRIYTDYHELVNTPALIKVANSYGVTESQEVHKSDDDSFFTMLVLKGLCEESKLSVSQLIDAFPHCKCSCQSGELTSEYLKYREFLKSQKLSKMEKLTGSMQENWVFTNEEHLNDISDYMRKVYIDYHSSSPLCGKKVCISNIYEDYHYSEMMNIISILASKGAKYTKNAYYCDIFVEYELFNGAGKRYNSYRIGKAFKSRDNGANIEFVKIEDFMNMIETCEEELSVLDKDKLYPLRFKYSMAN